MTMGVNNIKKTIHGFVVEPHKNNFYLTTPATKGDNGIVTAHDCSGFMGSWEMKAGGCWFPCENNEVFCKVALSKAHEFCNLKNKKEREFKDGMIKKMHEYSNKESVMTNKVKVLGIDQSLSKTAFCEMVDGVPVKLSLSKTGASKVKNKRTDTTYYEELHDQIHHVCLDLDEVMKVFKPDMVTLEALSFGSVGDATRNLAELMGAMRETLKVNYSNIPVSIIAPTSLKAYARGFLKPERQYDGVLATGKPKKVKMDKKMMVEAVKELYGQDYLKGYNYSSGLDDLSDATWLAHKTWSEYAKK